MGVCGLTFRFRINPGVSGKAKPSNKRLKDQHAEGILIVHHVEEQKPGEVARSRQDLKKGSMSVVIRASIRLSPSNSRLEARVSVSAGSRLDNLERSDEPRSPAARP